LKDLLVGQILWVKATELPALGFVSAAILALWLWFKGRVAFYLLFACAVTVSVQLVGIYLVFATLIVPALASRRLQRGRRAACYLLGALGYAVGLPLSAVTDLPTGPLVVCTMTALGVALFLATAWRTIARHSPPRSE
jgi:zinc/manganese transport system permease protein